MMKKNKVHVLVFPYPAQGHMLPLLNLTHHLALRGLLLTVLVTPKNLPILQPLLSSHPSSVEPLVLPFPPHPSIPPGVENVKDLPVNGFVSMMHSLHSLHSPIVSWFRAHPNPPVAIISDMFLGWTHRLAEELDIKRFEFSPSGAFALSVIYSLWKNMPERADPDDDVVTFDEVPSCPKYPWRQLSTVFRAYVKEDPVSEMIRLGFVGNMESSGLVVNSFDGLEGVYLEYLRKKTLAHGRVWAVGPLLPEPNRPVAAQKRGGGGSGSVTAEEIESWLDAREDEKVVYVCFGSQAVLTDDQLGQLALGLEKSGVHFIMCVKGPTDGGRHVEDEDCLSVLRGLRERVAGRGLVIRGWAPQMAILGHRAVGAFLTHCGWNSVLEGVMAGVALLCWPMGADQYSDATLLVEQLEVGVRVCEGARTVPDSDIMATVVADAVSEKHVELRKRVKALREAALEAVREGGSSVKDLDGLVEHLAALQNL